MVRRHRAGAALVLFALVSAGCGEHRSLVAPQVGSSSPPAALAVRATRIGPAAAAGLIRYRIDWQAPATADHFVYTLDPRASAAVDARWIETRATSFELAVPTRSAAMVQARGGQPAATTFLVRAVDRDGRLSPLRGISIVADNIAPTVQILQPAPSEFGRTYVPPHITITWTGSDPDGQFTNKPVKYKYTLLTQNSAVPFQVALQFPDSVRRRYEPTGYAEWDSVGGDTTSVTYDNLAIGQDYMFVVVARDEQGAYSQVFDMNSNMLNMRVTSPLTGGPVFTLFSSTFNYTYPVPSYSLSAYQIPATLVPNTTITVNWFAQTTFTAGVQAYRWALDIGDVFDETPRSNEATDLAHWSAPNLATTSATVGPFGPSESHVLYVDAVDTNGLKSLAMVHITTTPPYSADHELLIVDDTRLKVDQILAGQTCPQNPLGRWPTAAELDTFLYARGGVPWRCYPAGAVSPPGLFSEYSHDTLGTRGLASGTVPLATLLQYRHVIWLTDQVGATFTSAPTSATNPMTSLRYMSSPTHENTLAQYVAAGGSVWLAGGGIAAASTWPYNSNRNDTRLPAPGLTFTSDPQALNPDPLELQPGRFAWDALGWRSEIKVITTPATISRSLGRLSGAGSAYDLLPAAMRLRNSGSDPLPPLRLASDFYTTIVELEYLSRSNDLFGGDGASALDSLYAASGAGLVPPQYNSSNVCMTVHHPPGGPSVIFSGFSLWGFQRADSKALVDFVLRQLWGADETPYSPPIREHDPTPIAKRP